MTDKTILIKQWIKEYVIQYNLCPFALPSFRDNKIKFINYTYHDTESLLEKVFTEAEYLEGVSEDRYSNTIIIISGMVTSFIEYYDKFLLAEELIEMSNLDSKVQLVSFHPEYLFADTEENSPRNFTNRSPFPLIQILRKSEVQFARLRYKNLENIPIQNKIILDSLKSNELSRFTKQHKK